MRHFISALKTCAKCLNALDNRVGGPDRDRTDDLLHAMQARVSTVSNLSSNTFIFQLVESVFTRFTHFIWFHKTIGGNLGETQIDLPALVDHELAFSIAQSGQQFKAISFLNHHIKTTSRGGSGEGRIYGDKGSQKDHL